MGHREPLKGGAEWDVLTGWRTYLCYTGKPGVCKGIKRGFNKRVRREATMTIHHQVNELHV